MILRTLAIASNFSLVFGFIFNLIMAGRFNISRQQAFVMLFGQQEILYTLLASYDFPINMKNFWRYFTWVQLELNFLPNIIRDLFMDMSQIKYGEYAENFQFLSKHIKCNKCYRFCSRQFPSECPHENLHMVFLHSSVRHFHDPHETLLS